jgi:hypothetical protein
MSFDPHHRASHGLTINRGLRNLLGRDFVLCSREGEVIMTIAADYEAAKVTREPGESREMFGMPVDVFSVPNHVSLPCVDGEPIIVALVVAEAMRYLGKKRPGQTFSPMPLVMIEGKPMGSPGLILHPDLLWVA